MEQGITAEIKLRPSRGDDAAGARVVRRVLEPRERQARAESDEPEGVARKVQTHALSIIDHADQLIGAKRFGYPKLNQGNLPCGKIIYCTDHAELLLGHHLRQNRGCLF